MSFIIENGALKGYTGSDTNIVIPDEVKEFAGAPAFLGREEPFTLTLSPNMTCRFGDLLSEGIAVVNIPAGTKVTCSDCSPIAEAFSNFSSRSMLTLPTSPALLWTVFSTTRI